MTHEEHATYVVESHIRHFDLTKRIAEALQHAARHAAHVEREACAALIDARSSARFLRGHAISEAQCEFAAELAAEIRARGNRRIDGGTRADNNKNSAPPHVGGA